MKKRMLALSLVVCMVLGMAACGSSGDKTDTTDKSTTDAKTEDTQEGSDETQKQAEGDPVKLVVSFRTSGNVPSEANIHKVEDALNEILREKINAEVELMIIQSGSYKQQMTLMLSGDEQLDVMGATANIIPSAVAGEQLRDLGELLDEYGQGIKDILSSELLSCGEFNGVQYCIPIQADSALGMGYYTMRKDIVDKYDIDVSAIKTYDDLTEVFQLVHDNEPDLTIVAPASAGYSFMQYNCAWDKLGDYFGVLDNCGQDGLEVVNLFETENYKTYLSVMREWYTRGFISADVTNSTESGGALMKAGTLFAYCNSNKPGIDTQESMNSGREVVGAQVLDTITWTGNNWQWTIPENSRNPEKAMEFLNLLYTDPDVLNTIVYGIEGEDYILHDDGRVGYPEGIDSSTVGYSMANMLWSFGYEFNAYVWETNDSEVWEQTKEWNETGLVSKAYGFVFDSTSVANEMASVQNVYDQYRMSLECGVVDPDEALDEMNEKLYTAGLQTIIDEKQRQLDEWAAENNK